MKLKHSIEKTSIVNFVATIFRRRKFGILSFILYTILIFSAGVYLHKTGFIYNNIVPLAKQNLRLVPKMISGAFAEPQRLVFDIKHKNFQKIAYQREVALQTGVLIKTDDDYVPGRIRLNDKSIKVKLRLKGDWTDHLQGEKWSYRVVVKGENTIFGMKTFSLQHPKTRNYINEWLFHKLLKHEGLIGLRYDFVSVTVNGKDLGIYALEEHFEKRLIEHNALREGPIVKFNENLLWREKVQQHIPFPQAMANGSGFYLSSDVDGFQTNKWLAEPASASLYSKAIHLLESFRRGVLEVHEVFDVQKLAKFFAIVDLVGGKHATIWHNFRFYYNPVTSRLEPIGFDADCGYPIEKLLATSPSTLNDATDAQANYRALFFKDPAFFEAYMQVLERLSVPSYLDAFFDEIEDELQKNLKIIYSEFPYYEFTKELFYQNQRYIQTALDPVKGLHAYFRKQSDGRLALDLGNIQSLPVQVLNLSYRDSLKFGPETKVVLPAHYGMNLVDYRQVSFSLPEHFTWADSVMRDLKIWYKILGTSKFRYESVFPFPYFDEDLVINDFMRQQPNIADFEFLAIDSVDRKIVIKPGEWEINYNMIIPAGYTFVCSAGTRLLLTNAATILSYSPLLFMGTESAPIRVQSPDSSGQGIVVMNAEKKSTLRFVRFDNLSNPSQASWALTSAVTFYESPVDISYCEFANNRSEDALNIIRTNYSIENALFTGTQSDAFDADFADGTITNTLFINCGNDGIDISGSVLEVQQVFVDNAGDKGLSAGENSRMIVEHANIKNTEIAVASKDQSEIQINTVKLSNCKIGFTAFQKKAEFGPASIKATHLQMANTKIPYLIEEKSRLTVDGTTIPPSRKNVKEILYGVEYGKSSK